MGLAMSVVLSVPSSEGAIPGPLLALIAIAAWIIVIVAGLIFVAVASPVSSSKTDGSKREGEK